MIQVVLQERFPRPRDGSGRSECVVYEIMGRI